MYVRGNSKGQKQPPTEQTTQYLNKTIETPYRHINRHNQLFKEFITQTEPNEKYIYFPSNINYEKPSDNFYEGHNLTARNVIKTGRLTNFYPQPKMDKFILIKHNKINTNNNNTTLKNPIRYIYQNNPQFLTTEPRKKSYTERIIKNNYNENNENNEEGFGDNIKEIPIPRKKLVFQNVYNTNNEKYNKSAYINDVNKSLEQKPLNNRIIINNIKNQTIITSANKNSNISRDGARNSYNNYSIKYVKGTSKGKNNVISKSYASSPKNSFIETLKNAINNDKEIMNPNYSSVNISKTNFQKINKIPKPMKINFSKKYVYNSQVQKPKHVKKISNISNELCFNIQSAIKILKIIFSDKKYFYWNLFKINIRYFQKRKIFVNRSPNNSKKKKLISVKKRGNSNAALRQQSIERFKIEKNSKNKRDKSTENLIKKNLIRQNQELEKKLKQIEEENKKLKINKQNYDELENKYNKIVIEKNEIQNKTENIIKDHERLLKKLDLIENKTKDLILENNLFFATFTGQQKISLNSNDPFYFNMKLKIVYLRYLLLKKIAAKNKIISKAFNTYKEKILQLKEKEIKEEAILKRNKHLKDLVYNKIKEKINRFHRYFTKFYYKGLLNSMKVQAAKNSMRETLRKSILQNSLKYSIIDDTSSENNNNNNQENNNKIENESNNNINNNNDNLKKENSKNINSESEVDDNLNKQKSAGLTNNLTEIKPELKEPSKTIVGNIRKAKNLRKLLMQKNKEKLEILRKYFYKLQYNGIISFFKKEVKNMGKSENEEVQQAIKIVQDEENAEKQREEERAKKKEEEEKKKMEEMKYLTKLNKLQIILSKKDRYIAIVLKNNLERWNLAAKIISLNELNVVVKKKKKKKKGKKKENKENDSKEEEDSKKEGEDNEEGVNEKKEEKGEKNE